MFTKDTYVVIRNPLRLVNRHEVWVCGVRPTFDEQGYRKDKKVVKMVKAFRSEQKAQETISYWQEIAKFKEEVDE